MLKNKVFITDIDNLTDARYFAAWMVDWLCFPLDRVNNEDIIEIANWLEGTNFAVQISDNTTLDVVFELSQKTKIAGLLSNTFSDEIKNAFPDISFFILEDNRIRDLNSEDKFSLVNPSEFSMSDSEHGIWLKAQGEDKTGFKDFNKIDQVFDMLSE